MVYIQWTNASRMTRLFKSHISQRIHRDTAQKSQSRFVSPVAHTEINPGDLVPTTGSTSIGRYKYKQTRQPYTKDPVSTTSPILSGLQNEAIHIVELFHGLTTSKAKSKSLPSLRKWLTLARLDTYGIRKLYRKQMARVILCVPFLPG